MYIVLVQEKQLLQTPTQRILPYLADACTQEKAVESVQHERKQFEPLGLFFASGSERGRETGRPASESNEPSGRTLRSWNTRNFTHTEKLGARRNGDGSS